MMKIRLDVLVTERGLLESRERAKAVIMAGNVFIDGKKAEKAGMQVERDVSVEVRETPAFVSRGGQKLDKALKYFGISPEGRVCIDCGASTGGFTDCLLQNGAKLVYAVDVGYGQLAWNLRTDSRVVVMERTNIRNVTTDMFEIIPEFAVVDLSFISLGLVLPVIRDILTGNGEVICLIKPQFEAGKDKVGKKGVVRDAQIHRDVLKAFIDNAEKSGFSVNGLTHSPVRGPEGNIEYLGWLSAEGESVNLDINKIVMESHEDLT